MHVSTKPTPQGNEPRWTTGYLGLPQAAPGASRFELSPCVCGELYAVHKIPRAHCELTDVLPLFEGESIALHIACEMAPDVVAHLKQRSVPVSDLISEDQPGVMVDLDFLHLWESTFEVGQHLLEIAEVIRVRVDATEIVSLLDRFVIGLLLHY